MSSTVGARDGDSDVAFDCVALDVEALMIVRNSLAYDKRAGKLGGVVIVTPNSHLTFQETARHWKSYGHLRKLACRQAHSVPHNVSLL